MAPLEAERPFASVVFASLVTEQMAQLGIIGHAHDNLLPALALTGGVGELLNYWTSAVDRRHDMNAPSNPDARNRADASPLPHNAPADQHSDSGTEGQQQPNQRGADR